MPPRVNSWLTHHSETEECLLRKGSGEHGSGKNEFVVIARRETLSVLENPPMGSELARVFITFLLELLFDIHHYLLFPLYFCYLHLVTRTYFLCSGQTPVDQNPTPPVHPSNFRLKLFPGPQCCERILQYSRK